jgi:N-acetylglucosamine kinase-like BadF-type ATPase
MRALLIDGGQSGCRFALAHDGAVGPAQTLPGLARAGRSYEPLRALVAAHDVDLVAAGLTGYTGEDLRLDAPRVRVTNDAVTAYLGALGDEPGAVVVAGTGAIALACARDGRWARADGWGTHLGDDGGGYWIGRRALALALRAQDGRGGSPALLRRAQARYGRQLVRALYDVPDTVAAIAAFAPDVAAAARDGDELAAQVWREAGQELARTVAAALAQAGAPPVVSWSGGVFAAGDLILAPFIAQLGFEPRAPLGDGLAGAARLAAGTPRFASLVHGGPS